MVFSYKLRDHGKNTSILLGDSFDNFINRQIQSGRFSSASEVVRAALRLFEQEENQKRELIKELKKGEKSGFVPTFDRKESVKNPRDKHVTNGV
ncbi:MAG: type II toxin-antitoxin system ParD family antitoxin [Chitinophagaceae bacterium]|nr:type II toxin-antitoxin system ParD family antitoxin [Chitinophagaceae bacterium]